MTQPTNEHFHEPNQPKKPKKEPTEWQIPVPETLPKPSIYPVVLALGICFLAWGIVSSGIISAAGFVLSVIGFAGWIAELRRDILNP